MSLLQSPIKALDQIAWYLDNQQLELFPGAFLLSAGNLCRQTLEQILFILAFYSGMPRANYMKAKRQLKTAHAVWQSLLQTSPLSGRTYFEEARRRGPRIRKFARHPSSLNKWRRQFNEPSHFRNPAAQRGTREAHVRLFISRMRAVLDPLDPYLITAAVNEIRSGGRVRAALADDQNNTPGVDCDVIVTAANLVRDNSNLTLRTPAFPVRVIPDDREVPYRWPTAVVLVQHSAGMQLTGQFLAEDGQPINLTNLETTLLSLARTREGRKRLERRLRKLGYKLEWHRDVHP